MNNNSQEMISTGQNNITFIGGGNMATSLISGLIADGVEPATITVCDPDAEKLAGLRARFTIHTERDNSKAIACADTLVFAVKPQVLQQVACELAATVQQEKPLVISIAAGIREESLEHWLGGGVALVRAMPNTPALIQTGATVLHANSATSEKQRNLAETILRAVGLVRWVKDEQLMDAVTALSGSGPAYFFLVMEAMENAGMEMGLDQECAHLLTLQTALGAARMAIESRDTPAQLRQKVTSPGGTTERALETFEAGKLRELFSVALTSARDRSQELSDILGGKQ
ncbi:MAG: pyrroline-5-carboxylate reductase [Candidatus Polarisedimenticolaceae bacterium]|nr:pyrroline-5-carboxylate reductase [Candidatus Polarisedimenticolaceae bacterium]